MQSLIELIRRKIAAHGVLPFAEFMELALYCPVYGYYEVQKDNPGRRGDFFTSVSVGEFFGQLLAFQFAEWLEALNSSPLTCHPSLYLIEAGAHDGTLAGDILSWLQSARSRLLEQIQYGIIEPSPRRQEWQREKLGTFAPRVRWFTDFANLKIETHNSKLTGVIFSNELLDAMPVRRYGWDATAKTWFEWGVALDGEKFVWARCGGRPATRGAARAKAKVGFPSSIRHLPSSLRNVLPDGYTVETSPAAENWWREAAGALERGRLMTIDYGFTADELFSPSRPHGTLRAYFRHHPADDVLANAGGQDLTAHVNFSAIQTAGESVGLMTESFSTQSRFLTRILDRAAKDQSFGKWNPSRSHQFQTLTHPEHKGRAFRVLIQFKEPPATRS